MYIDLRMRNYEQLVREGVNAARTGRRALARRLLQRAVHINPGDAQAWLWLSATTDDAGEQRQYLERAVAADPANTAARQGLGLLTGELDRDELIPMGASVAPHRSAEPADARSIEFTCPQCGGRQGYDPLTHALVCEYCGSPGGGELQTPSPAGAQPVDYVLPTARGHLWTETQHRLACGRCGAITLLPPEEKSIACRYCGSHQLVETAISAQMVDPQAIGLVKIDASEAKERVYEWLKGSALAPDELAAQAERIRLRPAYYPFWTFEGALKVHWTCEVRIASMGGELSWRTASGEELFLFSDELVPGVKALSPQAVAEIAPFELEGLVEFQPDQLAGWAALTYDRPLADASLLARKQVVDRARKEIPLRVESGTEKRDLRLGAVEWSGLSFKHVLLPVWVGAYQYRGRLYRFLVNGQTGRVAGEQPRDQVKLAMVVAGALGLGIILVALVALLISAYGDRLWSVFQALLAP